MDLTRSVAMVREVYGMYVGWCSRELQRETGKVLWREKSERYVGGTCRSTKADEPRLRWRAATTFLDTSRARPAAEQ